MAGIDDNTLSKFLFQPDHYVIHYKEKKYHIEKKTLLTTIKEHLFWMKNEYRPDKVLKAIQKDGMVDEIDFCVLKTVANRLKTKPKWFEEKERSLALQAFQDNNHIAISQLDPKFKKDQMFMLEALKANNQALLHADPQLLSSSGFMLRAMKVNKNVLFYASIDLKKDPQFMLKALRLDEGAFFYADPTLKRDPEFMLEVLKIIPKEILDASTVLLENKDFMKNAAPLIPDEVQGDFFFKHSVLQYFPKS